MVSNDVQWKKIKNKENNKDVQSGIRTKKISKS